MNAAVDVSKVQVTISPIQSRFFEGKQEQFLTIIQLLANYNTVLDKLLQLPKSSPKHLSSLIQNELISELFEEVLRDIKSELQSAPFFSIILDTTEDVKKKTSKVFCHVTIDYHDDGTPSELKVVEAFISFNEVEDSSAIGLHKLITNSIQQKRFDIKKLPWTRI